jgi:hypothetical protein
MKEACVATSASDCGSCTEFPSTDKPRCMAACISTGERCKRQASSSSPNNLVKSWHFCNQHQDQFVNDLLEIKEGYLPNSTYRRLQQEMKASHVFGTLPTPQTWSDVLYLYKHIEGAGHGWRLDATRQKRLDVLSRTPLYGYQAFHEEKMDPHLIADVAELVGDYL